MDKESLFYTGAFNQAINISCESLAQNINIDDIILENLKHEVGDKCIKHGFISKDSIKINKRSIGLLNSSRFDGSLNYDISYTAEACNPTIGQIISCKVKSKNKMGILAECNPIIVVVSDLSNIDREIEIEDEVEIKLLGTRFDLFDKNITAIGTIVS